MDPSFPGFTGMTVNERLSWAGLLQEFHSAMCDARRQEAIELLGRVDFSESHAAVMVDMMLENPGKYGFSRSST